MGAVIAGFRSGRAVDFTKTYQGSASGYENPVDYVGRLSPDGMIVTGVWSLLEWNGTFEMHRDAPGGEAQEAETQETVPAS